MSISNFISIAWIEFQAFFRNPYGLFFTLAYPVILFVVMWAIFGGSGSQESFSARLEVVGGERNVERMKTGATAVSQAMGGMKVSVVAVEPDEPQKQNSARVVFGKHGSHDINIEGSGDGVRLGMSLLALAVLECATGRDCAAAAAKLQGAGGFAGPQNRESSSSDAYTLYLIVGIAVLHIFTTALFGVATVIVEGRANGQFRILELYPMSPTSFLVAFGFARLVIMVLLALVFLLLFSAISGAQIPYLFDPMRFLAYVFISILGGLSLVTLALVLAVFLKQTASASAVINTLNFLILMLSDLFIPLSVMPDWLQDVAQWSPIYLLVDVSRDLLLQPDIDLTAALVQPTLVFAAIAIPALIVAHKWLRLSTGR